MAELRKLQQAMCSIDLAETCWHQELPRLPVPDLWLTISRYLSSLKAVLAPHEGPSKSLAVGWGPDEDELRKRRAQFERTEAIVRKFMLVEGPQLQRDLKETANKCQNWATEYWLQDMYLSNAAPLPVHSNPFFLLPRQRFASSREMLMFATRLIQFSVDFKCRIDSQTLRQDVGSGHVKGRPLCMETYKNFFHSYRMPHDRCDRLLPQSRRSNHIVVASQDQFFVLRLGQDPLEDPYKRDSCAQLSESMVFEQLRRIYLVSRERARRHRRQQVAVAPKVGLFTTENRKVWARVHRQLNHCKDECNGHSLRQIEDCLFVLCLDSLVSHHQDQDQDQDQAVTQDEPSQLEAANLILTGCGSRKFMANRWFDKFLQIIVGTSGVCGINIEHSASEGITVLRFIEDFLKFIVANPFTSQPSQPQVFDYRCGWRNSVSGDSGEAPLESPSAILGASEQITPLEFKLDAELMVALEVAQTRADALAADFELHILDFDKFGRRFIKNQSLSPDAFVQLAMQLTFFKIHGHLVSTYESASLRQFRFGRVDNIRANTCEAFDWVRLMLECSSAQGPADWRPAEAAFVKAITKQVEILRYTIAGNGPDNHLMALRQMAELRYDETPELFGDQSYADFIDFRLSTSQLPNESGIIVGYGAVVLNGYGCSYNPREDRIQFCVSSFRQCETTNSAKFAQTLAVSLEQMQQLCLARQSD